MMVPGICLRSTWLTDQPPPTTLMISSPLAMLPGMKHQAIKFALGERAADLCERALQFHSPFRLIGANVEDQHRAQPTHRPHEIEITCRCEMKAPGLQAHDKVESRGIAWLE